MAKLLRQCVALTWLNVRTLPQRPGSSAVAVVGIAAVVAVFAGVLSMASGFEKTVAGSASPGTAIILREGVTTELTSGLGLEQTRIIADAPGVARGEDGQPIASAELFVIVDLKKKAGGNANAALRGIQPGAYAVRDGLEIIEGRALEPGRNELLVGRAAAAQFEGLDVGSSMKFGQTEWQVVGVFAANGSIFESELWSDVKVLQPAYRRGNTFQSVRVKLDSAASIDEFTSVLASDPRVQVDVRSEQAYFAEQAEPVVRFIRLVGYPLAILMAIGAIFAALNTMYSSVSARAREIATLRAIGFGPIPLALATLVESAVLALLGGVLGGAVAYVGLNGYTGSTMDQSFSQIVFNFAVTPELLRQGMVAALVVGLIGGLFPAVRAARVPVATALREL